VAVAVTVVAMVAISPQLEAVAAVETRDQSLLSADLASNADLEVGVQAMLDLEMDSWDDTLESAKWSEVSQMITDVNKAYNEMKAEHPKESDELYLLETLDAMDEETRNKLRKTAFRVLSLLLTEVFSKSCPAVSTPIPAKWLDVPQLKFLDRKELGYDPNLVTMRLLITQAIRMQGIMNQSKIKGLTIRSGSIDKDELKRMNRGQVVKIWNQACDEMCADSPHAKQTCFHMDRTVKNVADLKMAWANQEQYEEKGRRAISNFGSLLKRQEELFGKENDFHVVCRDFHGGLTYFIRREAEKIETSERMAAVGDAAFSLATSFLTRIDGISEKVQPIFAKGASFADVVSFKAIANHFKNKARRIRIAMLEAWVEMLLSTSTNEECSEVIMSIANQVMVLFKDPQVGIKELPESIRQVRDRVEGIKNKLKSLVSIYKNLEDTGIIDILIDVASMGANELGIPPVWQGKVEAFRREMKRADSHIEKTVGAVDKVLEGAEKLKDDPTETLKKGLNKGVNKGLEKSDKVDKVLEKAKEVVDGVTNSDSGSKE